MAGFLYFFPTGDDRLLDAGKVNPDILKRCGLERVFSETMTLPDTCMSHKTTGPQDLPGIVLYPKPVHGENPPHGTYHVKSQRWFDRGEFWIGVEKGNEPEPRDLERQTVYPGFVLKDQRGNRWSLPIIRSPDGRGSLPAEYGFDKDGDVVHRICREFRDAWDWSGEALEMLRTDEAERKSEADTIKMAVRFLGINYRVSIHEMAALYECDLAILDTAFALNVLVAVTNWFVWQEYVLQHEKKKTEAA